jgi:hypothetical protein
MTTKPIPEQARAYADALIAWSEGKKVEQRDASPASNWYPFDGEAYIDGAEYRVVPDPPKAREWWVNVYAHSQWLHETKALADKAASSARLECVHVRKILPTEIVVDKAEHEELRRNEAALKEAINGVRKDTGFAGFMAEQIKRYGARL